MPPNPRQPLQINRDHLQSTKIGDTRLNSLKPSHIIERPLNFESSSTVIANGSSNVNTNHADLFTRNRNITSRSIDLRRGQNFDLKKGYSDRSNEKDNNIRSYNDQKRFQVSPSEDEEAIVSNQSQRMQSSQSRVGIARGGQSFTGSGGGGGGMGMSGMGMMGMPMMGMGMYGMGMGGAGSMSGPLSWVYTFNAAVQSLVYSLTILGMNSHMLYSWFNQVT